MTECRGSLAGRAPARIGLFCLVALALALAVPRAARAQVVYGGGYGYGYGGGYGGFWLPQGDKPRRAMLNFKIGGAFGVYQFYYGAGGAPTQLAFQAEVGFPVTPDRNGYLILPFQAQVAPSASTVMLPIGFQYDAPLPVPGLYLTPRVSLGYALWVSGSYEYTPGATGLYHTGLVMPEIGIKYVVRGRLNLGADLVSVPIFFGADGLIVQYRLLAYIGFNI